MRNIDFYFFIIFDYWIFIFIFFVFWIDIFRIPNL